MPPKKPPASSQEAAVSLPEQQPAWAVALRSDITATIKAEIKEMVQDFTEQLKTKIDEVHDTVKSVSADYTKLETKYTELQKTVQSQKSQIDHLTTMCTESRDRVIKMESYSMRENLIFSGFAEVPNETEDMICHMLLQLFCDEMYLDVTDITVVSCHRLGTYDQKARRPRDIIARFSKHSSKKKVLFASKQLAGRAIPIYINEQFPRSPRTAAYSDHFTRKPETWI